MEHLHIIEQYPDRLLNYSGISLDDRFYFFHVSKDENEENEAYSGSQAGILRWDIHGEKHTFAEYPANIDFESYTPGKTVIHIASLDWQDNQATLTISGIDCTTMQVTAMYHHHMTDHIAEDVESSALWRLELYSLDDNYVLIKIPDLDPFSTQPNYGFSECLLIDLPMHQAYTIPPYLNEYDSLLNLSHIERYAWNTYDFLIISTGRVSLSNKKSVWEQQENSSSFTTTSYQTQIVISLAKWIADIKRKNHIPAQAIVDTCDSAQGYVHTLYYHNRIYFLKSHFATSSSEIMQYNLNSQQIDSLAFTLEFEKILMCQNELIGVVQDKNNVMKNIYALDSGALLDRISIDHQLVHYDNNLQITRSIDQNGAHHLGCYDAHSSHLIQQIIGERVTLSIVKSKDGDKFFLVHRTAM